MSNMSMTIDFSVGLIQTDQMYVKIDSKIALTSCSIISCSLCICNIIMGDPNIGIFYNTLKISNFVSISTIMNMLIVLRIKNPISSNYVISFASTDSDNFTK